MRVRKGMDAINDTRRVKGERARRKGLIIKVFVARVSTADVVRISCGKVRRRRDVNKPRASGIIANNLNL